MFLLLDVLLVDIEIKVLGLCDVILCVVQLLGFYDMEFELEFVSLLCMVLNGIGVLLGSGFELLIFVDVEVVEVIWCEMICQKMMEGFDISCDGGIYVIDIVYILEDLMFVICVVNLMVDEYFKVVLDVVLFDICCIYGWLDQCVQVLGQEVQIVDVVVV